ncbi:MAG: class I SAM-dependent methyltransferase [Magnetovibrionaceae bacterium]
MDDDCLDRTFREYQPFDPSALKTLDLLEGFPKTSENEYMDQAVERILDTVTLREYAFERGGLESTRKIINSVIQRSGLDFSGKILEFGAGNAKMTAHLSTLDSVNEIHVMDISKPLIMDIAPRVISYLGGDLSKVTFIRGDMNQPDTFQGPYDCIVSYGVLHHVAIPEYFLDRLSEKLAPGGWLLNAHEPTVPEKAFGSDISRAIDKVRKNRRMGINENIFSPSTYRRFFPEQYDVKLLYQNRFTGWRRYAFKLFGRNFFDRTFMVDIVSQRKV